MSELHELDRHEAFIAVPKPHKCFERVVCFAINGRVGLVAQDKFITSLFAWIHCRKIPCNFPSSRHSFKDCKFKAFDIRPTTSCLNFRNSWKWQEWSKCTKLLTPWIGRLKLWEVSVAAIGCICRPIHRIEIPHDFRMSLPYSLALSGKYINNCSHSHFRIHL